MHGYTNVSVHNNIPVNNTDVWFINSQNVHISYYIKNSENLNMCRNRSKLQWQIQKKMISVIESVS